MDVLVVGAGPSGSIAALVLARAGARVRLIDRARFPRDKLCGDTLNPGALALLDRLGIGADVRRQALPVSGMVVTGPGGARVAGDYGPGIAGAALTRRDLDVVLLEAARQAGAEIDEGRVVHHPLLEGGRVTGLRVEGVRGGEDARARMVVAADGRHSRLAFGLGLSYFAARPRRWAFGAYYSGVSGLTSRGEMHIRSDGYVGVASVPGDLANVCVVREWQRGVTSSMRGDIIAEALDADPALRERFARASRISVVTTLGPLAVESRSAGVPGLLLAGDAGGFIDPMTGDGMRFAVRGGELAATAALEELENGHPAYAALARRRRLEFSGKWRFNRTLRALVASPSGVGLAAGLTSRWSAPVRSLIALAGDVALARRVHQA
jgi:flavin-dependent dehydrogenase